MKLDYFDLLNPCGVYLADVGQIKSPKLIDIPRVGIRQYQYGLSLLLMGPKEFLEMLAKQTGCENVWDTLTEEQQGTLNIFALMTMTDVTRDALQDAMQLFFEKELTWNEKKKCYLVGAQEKGGKIQVDGMIDEKNYAVISDLCLQLAYIQSEKPETLKFKNERSRKFYERFQKKKEAAKKAQKSNPDYELANIISALAAAHNSLNLLNIWNLTVYQVHDAFQRQQLKNMTDIRSHNYAVWGGDDFKPEIWFHRMDKEE